MALIPMLIVIAICGALVWLILQIPMPVIFRNVILVIVSIVLLLFVLQSLGVHTGMPAIRLN